MVLNLFLYISLLQTSDFVVFIQCKFLGKNLVLEIDIIKDSITNFAFDCSFFGSYSHIIETLNCI